MNATITAEPLLLSQLIAQYILQEWGFTGTRAGMNGLQRGVLQRILTQGQPKIFRHGGAPGADIEVHRIGKKHCRGFRANVWPADAKRAALFQDDPHTTVEAPMPPLDRNVIIVSKSDFLIATPHTNQEEQRSGTWHTVRTAIRQRKPVLIVWPARGWATLYRDGVLYHVTYAQRQEPAPK